MPVPVFDTPLAQDNHLAAGKISSQLLSPSLGIPATTENVITAVVERITNFLLIAPTHDQFEASGRAVLRTCVTSYVKRQTPIQLVLPAFPFKSPSLKKVIGTLPDFAEELVLRRLEDLCSSLEDIYPPGVHLKLVSDGIVYSELLGVSDATVYQYNAELRKMVQDFGLSHISFVRMHDLLTITTNSASSNTDISEAEYVSNASETRAAFLSVDIGDFNVAEFIKSDEGALRTYRGYLRFLKLDLGDSDAIRFEPVTNSIEARRPTSRKYREKLIGDVAKRMMENGVRFSTLVAKAFPDAVRLSIHAHTNAGPKFAFRAFPTKAIACTPWHNTAIQKPDGSIAIEHNHTVDRKTHETVYQYGRPYFLREIDSDIQWSLPSVTFERLSPFGLIVRADPEARVSWNDVPMDKVRSLAAKHSLMIFRGFVGVDKPGYIAKAREMGAVQPWVFGEVLEVKDNPHMDLNNVLTREAMPMHFDGLFKTKRTDDGALVSDPPQFQMFQCIQAPPNPEVGGRTLFSNTAHIYRQVLATSQEIRDLTWNVFTPMNKNFGGDKLVSPIIARNPLTGRDIVRWHERWPQHITQTKPTEVAIDGLDESQSLALGDHLTELLYDRRFCYEHTWHTGDFLVADNIELLHSRTAFAACERELWRIHIN